MNTLGIRFMISAMAGAANVCSFAPIGYWWLMPICLATLCYYWLEATPKQALLLGLGYGMGFYLTGVYWIFVLAHSFNEASIPLAFAMLTGVALILTSYIALTGYLQARIHCATAFKPIIIASLWVLADWGREAISGFPWLDVGYSQASHLLSGFAPIGGVGLVTFVTVYLGCTLAILIKRVNTDGWTLDSIKLQLANLLLIPALGAVLLMAMTWSSPKGEPITAALIQANIPMEEKWLPRYRNQIIGKYQRLSSIPQADLIVWPETAIPTYLDEINPEFWHSIAGQGHLISGIKEQRPDISEAGTYISAIMTCEQELKIYRKQQLVPFGEYVAFGFILKPIAEHFGLFINEYKHWSGAKQSLSCGEIRTALSICFEIVFADVLRNNMDDTGLLINISEDAWLGKTTATFQRAQIAQMRAQELARPLLASSNSGPSAIISPNGEMTASSGLFVDGIIQGTVQPMAGATPFARWGQWIRYLAILFLIAAIAISYKSRSRSLADST